MSVLAQRQSIVVGVDGSERAMRAAVWAAAVAQRKSVPLRLAHVLPSPGYHYSEAALLFQNEFAQEVEKSAHEILDRAERHVKSAFPDITVSCSTHPGPAGPALAGLSAHAEMVVVGSTGAGALETLVTGSTVMQVVNRAHCPVTVFRSEAPSPVPDHRSVVVGVDGSELSSLAITTAVEFATFFEVPLLAVHGWGAGDISERPAALTMVNWAVVEEEQSVLMAENLAGWREKCPDLQLTTVIEQANPAELILEYARDAQLVVVGSHGHNRLAGAFLGSTGQNLLHHVACPITICRRAS
ncbi:universal stress protein [Rhodococcus sp. IEGM 248]|uniref:universal stress protein n=1 Tax=Rhodococcus opacus TaxID=37919 RepID=UPI0013C21F11|nr:universal stress protein [Rhodococcus opacus]MDV7084281.1 universal stress protein [Rhodococcus opacus]NDV08471.1 universal stress protein [Rhodococcus sp. IEGM 248]